MLASILNLPKSSQQWATWSFNHRLSHVAIIQAVQKQKGIALIEYPLDPIPLDNVAQWLEWNSESHLNMTAAVGLQSHDLQDIDFKDENQLVSWLQIHWREHEDVETVLGIGS